MSTTTELSQPLVEPQRIPGPRPHVSRRAQAAQAAIAAFTEPSSPVLPILTASVATHLLLVAWLGSGIPETPTRVPRPAPAPVTAIVENIELQAPPPEEIPPQVDNSTPTPDAPPTAADLALPPVPEVQAIAAVPSSVAVSFGIAVTGNVRLVSDAAHASGAVGGRRLAEPVALDLQAENNLVLPTIAYPARAKRLRQTGAVLVEFRTNSAGDVSDVRVRQSSGHPLLDEAARENLQHARWKGTPGYYVKAYEFTLQ